MCSSGGINKLSGNANFASAFAHATFEDVPNPQLPPNLLHVNGSTLVGEARVPCDDKQTTKSRKCRDYLLDDTVREIFLLSVAAEVLERQDGDGGFVRKR